MKRFLDPKFIEGFLVFCVIQPVLFFSAIGIFVWGIIETLWP
jgi:hypothetical protein